MVPQKGNKKGGVGVAIAVGVAALAAVSLIGSPVLQMTPRGRHIDSGIMEEVQAMREAGFKGDICAALKILLKEANRAKDNEKRKKIWSTQKAFDC